MKVLLKNLSILVLLIVHFYNYFGFRTSSQFEHWDFFDENFIQQRIVRSHQKGMTSSGLFNGSYREARDSNMNMPGWILMNINLSGIEFDTYLSQPGGQTIFFITIGKLLNLKPLAIYNLAVFAVIFLTSLILLMWLNYVREKYSVIWALIFLLFILSSPVLLDFTHRVWWSIYVFLLPTLLIIFKDKFDFTKTSNIFLIPLVLLIVKFFVNGFEFITPFLGTIIVVYFNLLFAECKQISFDIFISQKNAFLTLIGSLILGIFLCVTLLYFQIATFKGFDTAISHIEYSFLKRTTKTNRFLQISSIYKVENPKIYEKSLNANVFRVIMDYLKKPFLRVRYYKRGMMINFIKYWHIIAVTFFFTVLEIRQGHGNKTLLLFILSLFSSLSWFIIFKGHAHIHTRLDEIALYMPLIPVSIFIIIRRSFYFLDLIKRKNKPNT